MTVLSTSPSSHARLFQLEVCPSTKKKLFFKKCRRPLRYHPSTTIQTEDGAHRHPTYRSNSSSRTSHTPRTQNRISSGASQTGTKCPEATAKAQLASHRHRALAASVRLRGEAGTELRLLGAERQARLRTSMSRTNRPFLLWTTRQRPLAGEADLLVVVLSIEAEVDTPEVRQEVEATSIPDEAAAATSGRQGEDGGIGRRRVHIFTDRIPGFEPSYSFDIRRIIALGSLLLPFLQHGPCWKKSSFTGLPS